MFVKRHSLCIQACVQDPQPFELEIFPLGEWIATTKQTNKQTNTYTATITKTLILSNIAVRDSNFINFDKISRKKFRFNTRFLVAVKTFVPFLKFNDNKPLKISNIPTQPETSDQNEYQCFQLKGNIYLFGSFPATPNPTGRDGTNYLPFKHKNVPNVSFLVKKNWVHFHPACSYFFHNSHTKNRLFPYKTFAL